MQGRKNTKKIRRRRGVADWDGNGDVEWGWGADRLSDQEVDKMNRCFVWFGHVLDMVVLDMVGHRHVLDMFLVWFFRQSEGKLVGLRGRRIRGVWDMVTLLRVSVSQI